MVASLCTQQYRNRKLPQTISPPSSVFSMLHSKVSDIPPWSFQVLKQGPSAQTECALPLNFGPSPRIRLHGGLHIVVKSAWIHVTGKVRWESDCPISYSYWCSMAGCFWWVGGDGSFRGGHLISIVQRKLLKRSRYKQHLFLAWIKLLYLSGNKLF